MKIGDNVNIVVEALETHATWPWPPTAAQSEGQSLKYETYLFVLSPYDTQVMRNRIKYYLPISLTPLNGLCFLRSSSPAFKSYTTPEDLDAFTSESTVTKSGSTLTYGPFNNIPASSNRDFIGKHQQKLQVHFDYDYPVLEVTKLRRSAEISHWGANLNIENEIHLHNAGPT
jgi:oligosaccharyltransferase complex subunit alpha (ribophorin I)